MNNLASMSPDPVRFLNEQVMRLERLRRDLAQQRVAATDEQAAHYDQLALELRAKLAVWKAARDAAEHAQDQYGHLIPTT